MGGENIRHHFLRFSATEGNSENWFVAALACSEVDIVSVRRQSNLVNLLVEPSRYLGACAGRAIVGHQAPPICFETGSRLRSIDNIFSIAGINGTRIVPSVS